MAKPKGKSPRPIAPKSKTKVPLRAAKSARKTKTPSDSILKARSKGVCTDLLSPLPIRENPVRAAGNNTEKAFSRLQCGAVPESLPCREEQFDYILTFLEGKLTSGTGGCLYVSGVPGTGKTATVHGVIEALQQSVGVDDIPNFKYIEINGMRLSEPKQAYVQLWKELNGSDKRVTPDHASQLLDKFFNTPAKIESPIVLLVDELDLLLSRKQTVLYQLFDWPSRPGCPLIVLAIANTMDLPERAMLGRVSSRLGMQRLIFQPYTFPQLTTILQSRVEDLDVFAEEALEFVARKVAGVSGDARRALNICLLALEMLNAPGKDGESVERPKVVNISLVSDAIKVIASSPKLAAVQNASYFEKLFLHAVLLEFKRSGIEETIFNDVLSTLTLVCQTNGIKRIPSVPSIRSICSSLATSRLILLDKSTRDLQQRIQLNIGTDDVSFALGELF